MPGRHRRARRDLRHLSVAALSMATVLLLAGGIIAVTHLSRPHAITSALRTGSGSGFVILRQPEALPTSPASPTSQPVTTTAPTGEPAIVVTAPSPAPPSTAAEPATSSCSTAPLDLPDGSGGVAKHVAAAGRHIIDRFEIPLGSVLGVGGRSIRTSDHPRGYALDFMVSSRAQGDELAQYALDHQSELGVKYVIWRQRINHGNGWEGMSDRGSATANHFDHVHLSFTNQGPASPIQCS